MRSRIVVSTPPLGIQGAERVPGRCPSASNPVAASRVILLPVAGGPSRLSSAHHLVQGLAGGAASIGPDDGVAILGIVAVAGEVYVPDDDDPPHPPERR